MASENPPENLRCRFCLAVEVNELIPLFCIASTQNMLIAHMALACTGLVISCRDKLPQYTCDECLGKLDIAYACWKQCRQSWGNYVRDSSLKPDDEDYRCRICLKNEVDELISLFCICDTQLMTIGEVLKRFAGVAISKKDRCPKFICDVCLGQLNAGFSFRSSTRRSYESLLEKLKDAVNQKRKSPKGLCGNSANLDSSVLNEFLSFNDSADKVSHDGSGMTKSFDKNEKQNQTMEHTPEATDESEIVMVIRRSMDSEDPLKIDESDIPAEPIPMPVPFPLKCRRISEEQESSPIMSTVLSVPPPQNRSMELPNHKSSQAKNISLSEEQESSPIMSTVLSVPPPQNRSMELPNHKPAQAKNISLPTSTTPVASKSLNQPSSTGKIATFSSPEEFKQLAARLLKKPATTSLVPSAYVVTRPGSSGKSQAARHTAVLDDVTPILPAAYKVIDPSSRFSWAQIKNFHCKLCKHEYNASDIKEKCSNCNLPFDNYFSTELQRNAAQRGYIEAYCCKKCSFFAVTLKSLIIHLTDHQKNVPHQAVVQRQDAEPNKNEADDPMSELPNAKIIVQAKPTKSLNESTQSNQPKPVVAEKVDVVKLIETFDESRQSKQQKGVLAANVYAGKLTESSSQSKHFSQPKGNVAAKIDGDQLIESSSESRQSPQPIGAVEPKIGTTKSIRPFSEFRQLIQPRKVVVANVGSAKTYVGYKKTLKVKQFIMVPNPTKSSKPLDKCGQPKADVVAKTATIKPFLYQPTTDGPKTSKTSILSTTSDEQTVPENEPLAKKQRTDWDTNNSKNRLPKDQRKTRAESTIAISDSDTESESNLASTVEENIEQQSGFQRLLSDSYDNFSDEEFTGFVEEVETSELATSSSPVIDANHFDILHDSTEYQVLFLKGVLCCGCLKLFQTLQQLQDHRKRDHSKTHHSAVLNMCKVCKTPFSSASYHRMLSARRIFYYCKRCSMLLFDVVDFEDHRKIKHSTNVLRSTENRTDIFVWKQGVESVLRSLENPTHHCANPFKSIENGAIFQTVKETSDYKLLLMKGQLCCGCQHWFSTYDALLAHCDETHARGTEMDEFYCDRCQTNCKFESRLIRHGLQRSRKLYYYCKLCHDILVHHADDFQAHRAIAHKQKWKTDQSDDNMTAEMLVFKER